MIEKNLWNGRINNKIEPYGMMKKLGAGDKHYSMADFCRRMYE